MKNYYLKTEEFEGTPITSAYTVDGDHYIGSTDWAHQLDDMGIKPEKRTPDSNVCSIGFCEREQKWYGWSHRAMYGFGIGSTVKKGDCGYRAVDEQDFMEETLAFWRDRDYHAEPTARIVTREDGSRGVLVEWRYNDAVPNEALRGSVSSVFTHFPFTFGRGEWTAETLEDAKQMAKDYAEGVS